MKRMGGLFLAGVAALAFSAPRPTFADGDHERARRAVEAGEVLPLGTVLAGVEKTHPGHVLEVELERDDGRWIYEIRVMGREGEVSKLEVDARDGRVLSARGGRKREEAAQ